MSERRSHSRRGILKGAVAGALLAGLGGAAEAAPADAELLAIGRELEAFWAREQMASEACGDSAPSQELERVAAASGELCRRIVAMQARTPAGLAAKLRALTICRADEPEDDWIGEVIAGPQDYTTDQRLAFSILRDALAILKVGPAT